MHKKVTLFCTDITKVLQMDVLLSIEGNVSAYSETMFTCPLYV